MVIEFVGYLALVGGFALFIWGVVVCCDLVSDKD
jgi:hypothetical protein